MKSSTRVRIYFERGTGGPICNVIGRVAVAGNVISVSYGGLVYVADVENGTRRPCWIAALRITDVEFLSADVTVEQLTTGEEPGDALPLDFAGGES